MRTLRFIDVLRSLVRRLFGRGRPAAPPASTHHHPGIPLDSPAPTAPSPRLTYAVGTEPLPLQASPATGTPPQSTLTLLATNGTGAAVALQALQITLPVGADADDLTEDTPPAWTAPAGWAQKTLNTSPGQATYVFKPTTGGGTVAVEQALLFVLNGVRVNAQPGTFQVQVKEGSGGCDPQQPGSCPVASIPVTKMPVGTSVVSFSANPVEVSPGGGTELSWSGPAGATYTISWFDPEQGQVTVPGQGQPPLAFSGEYPGSTDPSLKLVETTVFTLNASMATEGWTGQQQVAVEVDIPAPAITSLSAVLSGPGGTPSLTVSWRTDNAVSCQLSGVSDLQAPSGSHTFAWPLEKSYTLTASGAPGISATKTVDTPPAIASFAGTCAVGASGLTLTLSWNALLADSCTVSNVAGTLAAPAGSATIRPTAADPLLSAYTLTAANGTATSTATATVQWGPGTGTSYPVGGCGALSPDGTRVYLYPMSDSAGVMLRSLSVPQLQPLAEMAMVPPIAPWASMAATGEGLLVADLNGALSSYDTTLNRKAGPVTMAGAKAVCASPDGQQAFVAFNSAVSIVDVATLAQQGSPLATSVDETWSVVVSADGSGLYVGGAGAVQAWHRGADSAWTPAGSAAVPEFLYDTPAVSPDAERLYVLCTGGNTLSALDAKTLQPVLPTLTLTLQPTFPQFPAMLTLTVSPDGGRMFVGCSTSGVNAVLVVDAENLTQVGVIDGFDAVLTLLAVTPDGAFLVAATSSQSDLGDSTYVIPPAGYSS